MGRVFCLYFGGFMKIYVCVLARIYQNKKRQVSVFLAMV